MINVPLSKTDNKALSRACFNVRGLSRSEKEVDRRIVLNQQPKRRIKRSKDQLDNKAESGNLTRTGYQATFID
jgi:hypothetical protein